MERTRMLRFGFGSAPAAIRRWRVASASSVAATPVALSSAPCSEVWPRVRTSSGPVPGDHAGHVWIRARVIAGIDRRLDAHRSRAPAGRASMPLWRGVIENDSSGVLRLGERPSVVAPGVDPLAAVRQAGIFGEGVDRAERAGLDQQPFDDWPDSLPSAPACRADSSCRCLRTSLFLTSTTSAVTPPGGVGPLHIPSELGIFW